MPVSTEEIRLNIGAGKTVIEGFTPIDKIFGHDALKLDYPDDSVEEIRASHILEHFSYEDARKALREWARVTKPGGRIRISVPDARKCLDAKDDPKRYLYLMGGQTKEDDFHRSAYDAEALQYLMEEAGIGDIKPWESKNTDCAGMPISLNREGVKGAAKTQRAVKIAAAMSIPRVGWNDNWGCVLEALSKHGIPVRRWSGAFWGQCLQRIFEEMVNDGVDWALTIDYDSLFTAKDLTALLDWFGSREEIDALTGLQCRRGAGTALMTIKGQTQQEWKGEPIKVDTAHFGLTLIRLSKLHKIPKPWFWSQPDKFGEWGDDRVDDDIYFWNKWKEAGNSIYVAPDCNIGHLELMCARFKVNGETFEPEHVYVKDWYADNGGKAKSW